MVRRANSSSRARLMSNSAAAVRRKYGGQSRDEPHNIGGDTSVQKITTFLWYDDQAEVDRYWEKLSEAGEPGPCGWLKDRWGLSWQITPNVLLDMLQDKDSERANRVIQAMLQMHKIDIAGLQKAYDG